jgi:hypothetical protein
VRIIDLRTEARATRDWRVKAASARRPSSKGGSERGHSIVTSWRLLSALP